MKHIKPYQIFENIQEPQHLGFPTTEEEIHELCEKYNIKNYTINKDLSVNVDGDVDFRNYTSEYLPLKFNYISGTLTIASRELKSLIGCPNEVGDVFNLICCEKLETLEGSPKKVGKDFYCILNNIKTLKGSPEIVGNIFACANNENLVSLEGCPKKVGKDFQCSGNENLKNIISFPYVQGKILPEPNHNGVLIKDPFYSLINTFQEKDNKNMLMKEFMHYRIIENDKVYKERLEMFCGDFDLEMPNLDVVKKHYTIVN